MIQLAVEVPVARWLTVNEPVAVAVIVVEGKRVEAWMPMPAAMPVGEVAQVMVVEFNVVPICADKRKDIRKFLDGIYVSAKGNVVKS